MAQASVASWNSLLLAQALASCLRFLRLPAGGYVLRGSRIFGKRYCLGILVSLLSKQDRQVPQFIKCAHHFSLSACLVG